MKISVETLEGLERKMTVQLRAEKISQAVDAKIKTIAKTVKIDGFRPGKVPLSTVKKMYGAAIKQEVLGDLIESTYQEAIVQEKIRIAGMPKIEAIEADDKEGMAYTASFEIYPEIKDVKVKTIKVVKQTCEIEDKDLDAMLEKLRSQKGSWKECKRKSKKGDQVICDFSGKLNGEEFIGGSGTNMTIVIGEKKMLKEFENGLKGMKAGDDKTLDVSFPNDYQGKDVAGKTAQFDLSVTKVSEPELPEIDEAFAKDFGVEDGRIETLKLDVKDNMERELSKKLKANNKNAVMDGLLKANQVDVPSILVKNEIQALKMQAAESMGQDPEKMDESMYPDELFNEEATRRVKLGVLIGEVIRNEKIDIDASKVDATLLEIASSYEDPKKVSDYYNNNKQAHANLEGRVLEDQVVDFILSQAKVSDKALSFDRVMNN